MNKVAIVGTGQTKFSKDERDVEKLLFESASNCIQSVNNYDSNDIDGVLVSTNNNSKYLGAILSETLGIRPKISHSIEHLCSSGTNAIISAYAYISSGLSDMVLVSGVESATNPGQVLEWDRSRGNLEHPIYWGSMLTKSHKRKFQTTEEELAIVSAKNHKHAMDNPFAYSNEPRTISEVMNSKQITDDLRILDCSRSCSGSSSILLASEEKAKIFSDQPIEITGIGQKTTSASFTKNILGEIESTRIAADLAYKMAKIEAKQIDVAEVHDAFSVCELMAISELGLTSNEKSGEFVRDLFNTENRMINPRGGLIGAGHPLGATGISQTIEITNQLQGKSDKRQISNAKIGLIHNMSAAGTSSSIMVLKN
ncbi:MAG: thiolase family protein [Candidatus Nitrosopelagicus sp.]|jgi:acetyl-CoA C-acetyltransferase|nr:thiolase family protein [Candidatus Nitrosopelagicus sp.]MBT4455001.1 thiolase family protein [Candidatus Nitrosopelagicus sp.]MBT5171624.1 thiolase family protein [Candidatus Nitrosopelagicus sp.]MBT6646431.1 thiolase family protein [Nitrososphaerota archaeon]MBT7252282.1 thiolase family protein [Candidatus Nitrosopelagicus sp.]